MDGTNVRLANGTLCLQWFQTFDLHDWQPRTAWYLTDHLSLCELTERFDANCHCLAHL